jgi:predicted Zn-dependent protease
LRYAEAAREQLNLMPFSPVAGIEYARSAIELIVIEVSLLRPSTPLRQAAQTALAQLRSIPSQQNARPTLLAWAQLARADASLDRSAAASALQTWVADQPNDAPVWQALASLYDAQGQQLRSLRAQAEARVALLDFGAALDRLKAAQEWGRANGASHIDASILDTRTRAVQAMVKELQAERNKP